MIYLQARKLECIQGKIVFYILLFAIKSSPKIVLIPEFPDEEKEYLKNVRGCLLSSYGQNTLWFSCFVLAHQWCM